MYFIEEDSALGDSLFLGERVSVGNTRVAVSVERESIIAERESPDNESACKKIILSFLGSVSVWLYKLLKIKNINKKNRRSLQKKYKQWNRHIFFFTISAGLSKFVIFVCC